MKTGNAPQKTRTFRTPPKRGIADRFEFFRTVFLESGLSYGRSFGSKSGYARDHSGRFYLANASVFTRDRRRVWTGDLDLAIEDDLRGLIAASRRLNRKLFIFRERSEEDLRSAPSEWFTENTVVTVWRGKVVTAGHTTRIHGRLEQILARSSQPR